MAHALGWSRLQVFTRFDYPLSEDELERCRQLLRRRASGESVAAIIGKKGFYHHDWSVGPGVLIPRPETEMLVDLALDFAQAHDSKGSEAIFRFADLGCGTGCIGLSIADDLLKRGRRVRAELWDVSPEALKYAEINRDQLLPAEHREHVHIHLGRVETEFVVGAGEASLELVVANPPYIDERDHRVEEGVKQHEPHNALFADENGLGCLRRWSETAVPRLVQGGLMIFEIGDGQGALIKAHFEKLGLSEVKVHRDLAGLERVVAGRKP